MLFSVLFVAAEAEHECAGEDCAICVQLAVCGSALKLSALTIVFAASAAAVLGLVSAISGCVMRAVFAVTPISLKVKLSD